LDLTDFNTDPTDLIADVRKLIELLQSGINVEVDPLGVSFPSDEIFVYHYTFAAHILGFAKIFDIDPWSFGRDVDSFSSCWPRPKLRILQQFLHILQAFVLPLVINYESSESSGVIFPELFPSEFLLSSSFSPTISNSVSFILTLVNFFNSLAAAVA